MKKTHTYFESWALAGLYGLVSTTAYRDHSYCVPGFAQLSHSTEKESLSLEFTGPVEHFGQIIFKLQVPRNKILGQEFSGTGLQIRRSNKDNSEIIFFISQRKHTL